MEVPPNLQLNGVKNVAVAGTAVQLSITTVPCCAVLIRAKKLNVGNIYFGGSTVGNAGSLNSTWLEPNEAVTIPTEDLNQVYINADNANDGVGYNAVRR
jgi:pantothenate kinase